LAEAERRRERRVALPAVASISADGKHLGICAVADISPGGALLVGDGLVGPGQTIEMALQLPGHQPVALEAKVLRRQVGPVRARKCAVKFNVPDAKTAEALAAACASPVPLPSSVQTLVVWNRPGSGGALPRDLTGGRAGVMIVSTPLEAAAWLRAGGPHIACVLIDYLIAGSNGWDFLQYLRESHPQTKRVLLVDGIGNFRLNLLLASGLADCVLEKPWSTTALTKKLNRQKA
jgi:CheY-like chemotaxis protein